MRTAGMILGIIAIATRYVPAAAAVAAIREKAA